jgi:hypothetical protein
MSEINTSEVWEGAHLCCTEQAEGVFMLQMAHVPNSNLASKGIEGCVANFMEHGPPKEVSELLSLKKFCLLRNPEVHNHIRNSSPLGSKAS